MQNVKKSDIYCFLDHSGDTQKFSGAQPKGWKWCDVRRLFSCQKEPNALFAVIIEMPWLETSAKTYREGLS
jgi:hypothetical protein